MKKKLLGFPLLFSVFFLGLSSCKKGENDPFLSMKTRKSRLCHEWVLESGESNRKYVNNGGQANNLESYNYLYQNDKSTYTYTLNGEVKDTETGKFERTIQFNKDYTWESHEVSYHENGNLNYDEVVKGNWAFTHKSKQDDYKNKERIYLNETYYLVKNYDTNGSMTNEFTYTGKEIDFVEIITLDRLSSKELHFQSNGEGTVTSNGQTSLFETKQNFNYKRN